MSRHALEGSSAEDPREIVQALIDQLRSMIEQARSMPMSASAVVNRAELLEVLADLDKSIPLLAGTAVKGADVNATYAEAQHAAAQLLAEGRAERERLIESTAVHAAARHDADAMRRAATEESEALRRETDDYVDVQLANFELTLGKTLEAVRRGRDRLQGRSELDALASGPDVDDIVLPNHP